MDNSFLPDWLQVTDSGLFCEPGNFHLDPFRKVPLALVTHAHADHFRPGHKKVFATRETLALGKARYRDRAGKDLTPLPWQEPIKIGEVTVTALPAGHMLGSAQFLIDYQGFRVLFTGDFNTHPNQSCRPLTPPNAEIDLLVAESTFGEKEKHIPPRESLLKLSEEMSKKPLLIGTYVMGKAQHLHQLLLELFPERKIFIHHEISKFHREYEKAGFAPGPWLPYRSREAKKAGTNIAYLLPPRLLSGYGKDYRWFKLIASGWDRREKLPHLDAHLDLSDHADFEGTMGYVRRIQPKKAAFFHGYPEPLINACEMLKIPAFSLNLHPNN